MLCGYGMWALCDGVRKHVWSGGSCCPGAARLSDLGQAHGGGLQSDIFLLAF